MKALVIRSPWIDLILSGSKTWEMRTKPTAIRGRIALIKAGSGLIYGTADLVDCLPALSPERLRQTEDLHGIADAQLDNAIQNRWTTPWVLRNVAPLETPKRYIHPSGAVTWVTLPDELLGNDLNASQIMEPKKTKPMLRSPEQVVTKASLVKHSLAKEWTDIQLTDGNIRNGHFYLRTVERLLPNDCIGGSNKAQAAQSISVQFAPGMLVETDIAGDKMIMRSARGQIRDFFERTQAKAGDSVRFGRVNHHGFVVTLQRANATAP